VSASLQGCCPPFRLPTFASGFPFSVRDVHSPLLEWFPGDPTAATPFRTELKVYSFLCLSSTTICFPFFCEDITSALLSLAAPRLCSRGGLVIDAFPFLLSASQVLPGVHFFSFSSSTTSFFIGSVPSLSFSPRFFCKPFFPPEKCPFFFFPIPCLNPLSYPPPLLFSHLKRGGVFSSPIFIFLPRFLLTNRYFVLPPPLDFRKTPPCAPLLPLFHRPILEEASSPGAPLTNVFPDSPPRPYQHFFFFSAATSAVSGRRCPFGPSPPFFPVIYPPTSSSSFIFLGSPVLPHALPETRKLCISIIFPLSGMFDDSPRKNFS